MLSNQTIFIMAQSEIDRFHLDVKEWIEKNTDINDVILTSNEVGFALNGLTGRKGINFRRAHSGSYVDVDSRYLDAAIILYGNNSEDIKKLLKKYDVKYVYWEYYWVNSEFIIDFTTNNVMGWYDPLMVLYSPKKEGLLNEL